MSEPTATNSFRDQAGADDERLAERLKSIMEHKEARPTKARSSNTDRTRSATKAKAPAAAGKPARPAKKKTPVKRQTQEE